MVDKTKHIWEGWMVGDFINALAPQADLIMSGQSWRSPFQSIAELEKWCADNQPYYKRSIPEVTQFFAERYHLR